MTDVGRAELIDGRLSVTSATRSASVAGLGLRYNTRYDH